MRAIALLSALKFKNSIRTLFSDPRKLVPLVILLCFAGLYMGLIAFGLNHASSTEAPGKGVLDPQIFAAIAFLLLVLVSAAAIDTGLGDSLLAFGMSDVDYVFPSPISRRVVLAYKLPSLTLYSASNGIFVLIMISILRLATRSPIKLGVNDHQPGWVSVLGLFLCIGTFMNLAMYISVRVPDRKNYHRVLTTLILLSLVGIGAVALRGGVEGVIAVANSSILRTLFEPANLAATILQHSQPFGPPLAYLALFYSASLIPMFATNANFYEQSIVSTERMGALRKAAKGGYASLLAANAAKYKHKSTKEYTLRPFGTGSTALFWAHLCAAAKKPMSNFFGPALIGLGAGTIVAVNLGSVPEAAYIVLPIIILYSAMLFLATAKTASENSIRRRELMSPLPIKAWHGVAANLGVPWIAVVLFCLGIVTPLAIAHNANWPIMVWAVLINFPIIVASRMVLQYITVLGYPDLADKVQQFLAMFMFQLFSMPLLIGEVILCVPGLLLKSGWVGSIGLLCFDIPALVILLTLAGKITEKAVATGEPVSLWATIRKRS